MFRSYINPGITNTPLSPPAGYKALTDSGLSSVEVDPCSDAEAAAEGAVLSQYVYQELKSKKKERAQVMCGDVKHTDR